MSHCHAPSTGRILPKNACFRTVAQWGALWVRTPAAAQENGQCNEMCSLKQAPASYEVCPEKVQRWLTQQEWFAQQLCNLTGKERGLEYSCMNNDDFTVLVSGGGRRCWVSMCTVWPSLSKWLSQQSKQSASNFALSFNIPLWKLFGWIRRQRLWATVIGSFITTTCPHIHHVLCKVFWRNIKSPRWLSPLRAQIWCPVTSGFSQN